MLTLRDEARYWSGITGFAYPTCIQCPCWEGGPRWFIAMTLGIEKLGWCGYSTVKIFEDVFIPVNKM